MNTGIFIVMRLEVSNHNKCTLYSR